VRRNALDPTTMKYAFVDTASSHHLQFDAKDRLGPAAPADDPAGSTPRCSSTGDAAKSQGWSPFILDTNGNGKRDEYTEPTSRPMHKDMRVTGGSSTYAVPNPADGSIWYTVGVFAGRGGVLRYDPDTQLSEIYNVPMPLRPAAATSTARAWSGLAGLATWAPSTAASARPAQRTEGEPAITVRGLVVPQAQAQASE
jgi:hypothetical protein